MLLWTIVFVLAAIIEIIIPALVSIWFALAALIMIVLSEFLKGDLTLQVEIYVILSALLLVLLRRWISKSKLFKKNMPVDKVKIVKIVEEKNDNIVYDVKYKGVVWTAISNNRYENDELIEIATFDGNKIILK